MHQIDAQFVDIWLYHFPSAIAESKAKSPPQHTEEGTCPPASRDLTTTFNELSNFGSKIVETLLLPLHAPPINVVTGPSRLDQAAQSCHKLLIEWGQPLRPNADRMCASC
ncbi:hypothetical protein TcWFU_006481 [Taenia crassiceps]|uniref:Uncharacterized protein n=1 Tax=Taenia crassiceps TaxID=6207 RepID=A0ABR4QH22_9CEST